MSKIRLFILLVLFSSSIFFLISGATYYRNTVDNLTNKINKNTCKITKKPLTIDGLITAKKVVEGIIQTSGLNLNVEIKDNFIEIKSNPKNMILDNESGYNSFVQFLNALSNLPYSIEYESFCFGSACGESDIFIRVKLT